MGILRGERPDLTPAQVAAIVSGGVPVLSNLLAAFGLWSPDPAQQAALADAVNWGVPLAGVLMIGDAGVRAARNAKDARVEAAALAAPAPAPPSGSPAVPPITPST